VVRLVDLSGGQASVVVGAVRRLWGVVADIQIKRVEQEGLKSIVS